MNNDKFKNFDEQKYSQIRLMSRFKNIKNGLRNQKIISKGATNADSLYGYS